MKKKWIFVLASIGIVLFIVVGGELVMRLWNWLLPDLFGWPQIGFWQALGLLVLCRILFGGHGMGGHTSPSKSRRKAKEKWDEMTPEERERFRQWSHSRWGGTTPPDSDPR